jgi:hypothetical protein
MNATLKKQDQKILLECIEFDVFENIPQISSLQDDVFYCIDPFKNAENFNAWRESQDPKMLPRWIVVASSYEHFLQNVLKINGMLNMLVRTGGTKRVIEEYQKIKAEQAKKNKES